MNTIDWNLVADLYDRHVQRTDDLQFWVNAATEADGPVLELMAGTGRVSLPLAEAGVDLTCVDRSAAMLDRLHRKLQRADRAADIVEADVARLEYEDVYSVVLLPFHGFTELITGESQRATLRSAFRALRPGGRFLVNIHDPASRRASADGVHRLCSRHTTRDGLLVVSAMETLTGQGRLIDRLQFYEQYDGSGQLAWKRCLPMTFALHEPEEFRRMADEFGFRVAAVLGSYDGDAYDPGASPTMLWDLRRPGADEDLS